MCLRRSVTVVQRLAVARGQFDLRGKHHGEQKSAPSTNSAEPAGEKPEPQRTIALGRRRGLSCGFSGRRVYLPVLKLLKVRVCILRISCGSASGATMVLVAAVSRKIDLFSATSFLTNFSEAAFGLA